MRVLLTFTYGVSLNDWNDRGIISREISSYKKLSDNNKTKFHFLTFGTNNDYKYSNLLEKIDIIPVFNKISSRIPKGHFIKSLLLPIRLKKLFKDVDIIKTNQIKGSWIACIAKILFRKKVIIRGGYEWLSRYRGFATKNGTKNYLKYLINYSWIFLIELFAFKLADGIILTNEEDISFIVKCFKLKKKFKNRKIKCISNFVDTDIFRPLSVIKKEKHIIFIGNLKKVKNLENLCRAFMDLKGFCLDIIGNGPDKKTLMAMVKKLDLRVNFLGTMPNNRIPEILNQYEIFILPSYYEGNPKALLEAMGCGIACIGSNIQGINSIIKHKENGYLCEPSYNGIRKAVEELSADENLRMKIGKNARIYVIESCSLNSIAQQESLFYKQILGNDEK